jgi:hypothetical protein
MDLVFPLRIRWVHFFGILPWDPHRNAEEFQERLLKMTESCSDELNARKGRLFL